MGNHQGGVYPRYPTKKALREAALAQVPFILEDTSAVTMGFHGSVFNLPEGDTFLVVGPDPYRTRNWYAEVKRKGDKVTVK